MPYASLREYLAELERSGDLIRVPFAVDPRLEITELCNRSLRADGPAMLFEQAKGSDIRVIGNLFGTARRVTGALALKSHADLRRVGEMLAALKEPQWPNALGEAIESLRSFRPLLHVAPLHVQRPPWREHVMAGGEVDLEKLPIQTCWPHDAGPLITWGLVITRGPLKPRLNIGIYRQQLIGRNKLIMRWLPHRGGAQDYKEWQQRHPGRPFPVAVAIGADPATLLAAVTPIPDTLSEFQFAGLLRGSRSEVARCSDSDLLVPATAEIVLEGEIVPGEEALEGPFGDHTGYYNSQAMFPVFTVHRLSMRERPLYQAGYMGRSPWDEPSVLASVLNEVFVPILQRIFPEVVDFHLPPQACSYRIAVVSIRKGYPGHARRLMFAVWSYLRQFTYTKLVIVTDDDINVRDWREVLWALATRMDPARDTVVVENTPIDYLDFASPVPSLGSKLGIDATNKWPGETQREWGRPIKMSDEVVRRVDAMWSELTHAAQPASLRTCAP